MVTDLEYFRAKSRLLQIQLQEMQLREERRSIFLSLGLDPNRNYRFNDDGCSIDEVTEEEKSNGIR